MTYFACPLYFSRKKIKLWGYRPGKKMLEPPHTYPAWAIACLESFILRLENHDTVLAVVLLAHAAMENP